jgi:hypothetical protein
MALITGERQIYMEAIRNRNRARGNSGQTLVEFALVVGLILAIFFGIVEFGRLWFYSNHLNNSVRAAARYAAVLGSTPDGFLRTGTGAKGTLGVDPYLRQEISKSMDPAQIASISVLVNGNATLAPTRGDTIEVTITYNFTVLSGHIIPWFNNDNPHTLIRSATMRYEG